MGDEIGRAIGGIADAGADAEATAAREAADELQQRQTGVDDRGGQGDDTGVDDRGGQGEEAGADTGKEDTGDSGEAGAKGTPGPGFKAVAGSVFALGALAAIFGGIYAKQLCLKQWHDKYAALLGLDDIDAMRRAVDEKMTHPDVDAAIRQAASDLKDCDDKDALPGLLGDVVKPLAAAAVDVAGALGAALSAILPSLPAWVWELALAALVAFLVVTRGNVKVTDRISFFKGRNAGTASAPPSGTAPPALAMPVAPQVALAKVR